MLLKHIEDFNCYEILRKITLLYFDINDLFNEKSIQWANFW